MVKARERASVATGFAGGGRKRRDEHPAVRPDRAVLGAGVGEMVNAGAELERRLRGSLAYVEQQIKAPNDSTGVRSYLRFAQRLQWDEDLSLIHI